MIVDDNPEGQLMPGWNGCKERVDALPRTKTRRVYLEYN